MAVLFLGIFAFIQFSSADVVMRLPWVRANQLIERYTGDYEILEASWGETGEIVSIWVLDVDETHEVHVTRHRSESSLIEPIPFAPLAGENPREFFSSNAVLGENNLLVETERRYSPFQRIVQKWSFFLEHGFLSIDFERTSYHRVPILGWSFRERFSRPQMNHFGNTVLLRRLSSTPTHWKVIHANAERHPGYRMATDHGSLSGSDLRGGLKNGEVELIRLDQPETPILPFRGACEEGLEE